MYSFFIALAILIVGFFIYGTLVEKVFGANKNNETPAYKKRDDVDFIPMPTWKVFLIQFLNIAGLGPIFGAIMGILYGPAAFLWISLGTIFGGAVHDYFSGMISIRREGASLPEIVGEQLGLPIKQIMRGFSLILMILVGAVFVINPASLLASMTGDSLNGIFSLDTWIYIIFAYYMLATLLPIDKLIGNLYPVFGFALLFMAIGIFTILMLNLESIPEFTSGLSNMHSDPDVNPIFPMMFVSIACGAISGFHATQSPMMARCMKNEKYGRPVFYGAMVAEGIVALIWAAAAIAYFHGSYDDLSIYIKDNSVATFVHKISVDWLGAVGGILAMFGVIAAPITSGDTALRSARLITADFMKFKQNTILRRLVISIPIFILCFVIMKIDFQVLWRYFGWCNQTLSVFTLWAITVYLMKEKKNYFITLIPAVFMSMVCITYIIFAAEGFKFDDNLSLYLCEQFNLSNVVNVDYIMSISIASTVTLIFLFFFYRKLKKTKAMTNS